MSVELIWMYLKKYPLQIDDYEGKKLVRIMTKNCYSFEPNSVKEKLMTGVRSTLKNTR